MNTTHNPLRVPVLVARHVVATESCQLQSSKISLDFDPSCTDFTPVITPVMASVKESIKESLLGTTQPEDLSVESRTSFLKFARQGEDGELFMGEEEFINAIAPPGEDYVSRPIPACIYLH